MHESLRSSAATLLLRLHHLNHEGQGKSDETSTLMGRLEANWSELSEVQRARLDGLSADLYALVGEEMLIPPATGDDADQIRSRLSDAFEKRDFDEVLKLLRLGPPRLPDADVAYARANCYEELGMPAAAVAFMDLAAALAPDKDAYVIQSLNLLLAMDGQAEAVRRSSQILADPASRPLQVIKACDVLHRSSLTMGDKDAQVTYENITARLPKALADAHPTLGQESLVAAGYVLLGTAQEHLGSDTAAIASYDQALTLQPDNDAALVARGLSRLEKDRPTGLRDLALAARLDTPLVYAYFFLAYNALMRNDFISCVEHCRKALDLPAESAISQADLWEWLGISYASLGQPASEVEPCFANATALAPLILRIRRNADEYRRFLANAVGVQYTKGADVTPAQALRQVA